MCRLCAAQCWSAVCLVVVLLLIDPAPFFDICALLPLAARMGAMDACMCVRCGQDRALLLQASLELVDEAVRSSKDGTDADSPRRRQVLRQLDRRGGTLNADYDCTIARKVLQLLA